MQAMTSPPPPSPADPAPSGADPASARTAADAAAGNAADSDATPGDTAPPPDPAPSEMSPLAVGPDGRRHQSLLAQAVHAGQVRVHARGLPADTWLDVYHRMLRMRWRTMGLWFGGVFLGFNLLFAALYMADPTGLALNGPPLAVPLYWRDFFFSVHTVATIGYGNIVPVSMYANIVVVVEITFGILMFALGTGMVFARFSRPTGRIVFSRRLVVRDVDGVPTLMLRAANQRHNMIFSVEARLSVLVDAEFAGTKMRRFMDVPLVRSSNPVFALTWLMMHRIEGDSPLLGWLDGNGPPPDTELIVVVSGVDEASGQIIHGRWAYRGEDVAWGARFVDIIENEADGWRIIHYERFHEVITDSFGPARPAPADDGVSEAGTASPP